MPKKSAKKAKPAKIGKGIDQPAVDAVELVPDAWPKFEKLVKTAAKMGPKPHGKKS